MPKESENEHIILLYAYYAWDGILPQSMAKLRPEEQQFDSSAEQIDKKKRLSTTPTKAAHLLVEEMKISSVKSETVRRESVKADFYTLKNQKMELSMLKTAIKDDDSLTL